MTSSSWRPSCGPDVARARARLHATIRAFFAERGVLEVDTPILSRASGTDPHLDPFVTADGGPLWLMTSPEFHMKRLLAAGWGSIFQIGRAFRRGETGRWHNPEFSLLEWYRVGLSFDEFLDETALLLRHLLPGELAAGGVEYLSYAEAYARHVGIDPLQADIADFERCAHTHGLPEAADLCGNHRSDWLDLLFSHLVQPQLGRGRIAIVHSFPACQAALARLDPHDPRVAQRAEIFVNGLELANGYHELSDATEQAARFEADLARRRVLGLPLPVVDRHLLDALEAGLPDCCGMAMGLDRVLMLVLGADSIEAVLSFPIARA